MLQLCGCFSNLIRTVCGFVNRHHVLDDAGGSAITLLESNTCSKGCSGRNASRLRHIRRALLSMLVAAATIFAMLIISPNSANAAQVWWLKDGHGYFANDDNNSLTAFQYMHIGYPEVNPSNPNHVRYTIDFNYAFYNKVSPTPRIVISKTPWFYVFLPSKLIANSIKIVRSKRSLYGEGIARRNTNWQFQTATKKVNGNTVPIPETVSTWYSKWHGRYTHNYNDTYFQNDWNDSVGSGFYGCKYTSTGKYAGKYSLCEVKKWLDSGDFGVELASSEKSAGTYDYEWVIDADMQPGSDPHYMPIVAGYQSNADTSHERLYAVYGPYDTDGDGIPDNVEYANSTDPDTKGGLKFEVAQDAETWNSASIRPYVEDGTWQNISTIDENNNLIQKYVPVYSEPGVRGRLYENIPKNLEYSSGGDAYLDNNKNNKIKVTFDTGNAPTNSKGHVWVDSSTGRVLFNADKYFKDTDKTKDHVVTIPIKITYPDPTKYHCTFNQQKTPRFSEIVEAKFHVWPMSHFYKPVYPDYEHTQVMPGETVTSTPKNDGTNPYFPQGTWFEIGQNSNKSQPKLSWSKINDADKNTGKVTFTPGRATGPGDRDTPVIVHYPDGSTSKDGNQVYAHVRVNELTAKKGSNDLHLVFYLGKGTHDGDMGPGYSENSFKLYKHDPVNIKVDKTTYTGLLLDSWSGAAKGKIQFRAICHKVGSDDYKLLKPSDRRKDNNKDNNINGLTFTEFHSWDRATTKQEQECSKDAKCDKSAFDYKYIGSSEYNKKTNGTMERSRALIGTTQSSLPRKTGRYECRVFAFHDKSKEGKTQYNKSLEHFDTIANLQSSAYGSLFNFGDIPAVSNENKRGVEWVENTFQFMVKAHDNQIYNPTYKKVPTIKAGLFENREFNSSDKPRSTKDGNGVSLEDDKADIIDGERAPKGTWFTIKRLVKKVDGKDPSEYPQEKNNWSAFEDNEDNKVKDKSQAIDSSSARVYGSVTFRPNVWQKPGEYWAEVVVHYPDGTSTDQKDSVNYNHPVYAKVKVDPPDVVQKNDVHISVRAYEPVTANESSAPDISDPYNQPGTGNGITLMSGMELRHKPFIDAWSMHNVRNKVDLRVLCDDPNDDSHYNDFSSNLGGLKVNNPVQWSNIAEKGLSQDYCLNGKGKGTCEAKHILYGKKPYATYPDDSPLAAERTTTTVEGYKSKPGNYVCAAWAFDNPATRKAFDELGDYKHSIDYDDFMQNYGYTKGVDYDFKTFVIRIAKPFRLPETGDCGWNASLCVVSALLCSLVAAVLVMDQTKRGHELLGRWRLV